MRAALDLRDDDTLQYLIGRPSRTLDNKTEACAFTGERVLITGAGGSIGSELARQIARRSPDCLTLVDNSEYALFRIEKEVRELFPRLRIEAVLGDITRRRSMKAVFERVRPNVVFHAAAYKHVSMLERDVLAAVRSNVLGSLSVARLTRSTGGRLVLISSDKAANPESIMGATKRLAELAVLAETGPHSPAVIVRFGNVLGSSGSVVEVMLDRIRRGLPVQVTDPLATRYFMSASEAVSLVLEADRLRQTADIVWLEMGEPVNILELANRLRTLAEGVGLPDVPVEFIGLRPGEKLREELTVQGLELVGTNHPDVWIARQSPFDARHVRQTLAFLRERVRRGDSAGALALLCSAVPEYSPSIAALDAAGTTAIDANVGAHARWDAASPALA